MPIGNSLIFPGIGGKEGKLRLYWRVLTVLFWFVCKTKWQCFASDNFDILKEKQHYYCTMHSRSFTGQHQEKRAWIHKRIMIESSTRRLTWAYVPNLQVDSFPFLKFLPVSYGHGILCVFRKYNFYNMWWFKSIFLIRVYFFLKMNY